MSRRRTVLAFFAVLLVAILLAWYRLPVIAEYLLAQQLREAGFSEIRLEIEEISTTRARIDTLRASHPAIRLAASAIVIEYSLAQLWQGKVNSLSLDSLQLVPIASHDADPAVVLPPLPDRWLASIPFQSASFNRITLTLPTTDQGFGALLIQGNMQHSHGRLQINADLAAQDRPPLRLAMHMDSNNELGLAVAIQDGAAPFVELNSRVENISAGHVETALDLQADLVTLRTLLQKWLPGQDMPMQFDSFSGNGNLAYSVADQQAHGDFDISLTGTDHTAKGPVSIVTQPGHLAVTLKKTFSIGAKKQRVGEATLPILALAMNDDLHCSALLAEARWQCGAARLQLAQPEVRYPPYIMRGKTGIISLQQLGGDAQAWHATAGVELNTATITLPDNAIRIDRVLTQVRATSQNINATANLLAADSKLSIEVRAMHNLQQENGSADIELQPVSLDASHNIPGKLLQRWPYPVHIEAGKLHGKASVNWKQENGQLLIDQTSTLELDNIEGQYREFPFRGLQGTLIIRGIDSPRLESPSGIRLSEFNPGVTVNNAYIRGTATLEQKRQAVVSLTEFSAGLLGGRVYGKDTVLDFNRDENPLLIYVEGLDISALIELEQKEGLFGTGKLDGALPLTLGQDGLRMEAGSLAARPPGGVIRYSGDERVLALAKSNPNVELLLKALNDFRYHLLEANLDYAPDGQLLAKLRLQGNNPELEGGRTVHLNINLEENILTLLRSLQFADEISRKIGEGIERGNKHP